jgi:hypothetical protein
LTPNFFSVIEETFPIPGRFRSKLPFDVAELSRLLTCERGERDIGYLNRPNLLSAYLRYFLPWNVFRLCRLFSLIAGASASSAGFSASPTSLSTGLAGFSASSIGRNTLPLFIDGDAVTDLGSGPLTLPLALWIAFPELRRTKLEFRCVDKSAAALDAGHKLFKALCAASGAETAWKIKAIHASMEEPLRGKPAKLVSAINVFNEVSAGIYTGGRLERIAQKAADLLERHCAANGSILAMEPGNPQGGAFITALRAALLERGRPPAAPCPHAGPCPMHANVSTGFHGEKQKHQKNKKAKWCHFAFDTEAAPPALHKLSIAAGIPKERATLSFLLAGPVTAGQVQGADSARTDGSAAPNLLSIRIISDVFPVSGGKGGTGRYGCSRKGMVLVTGSKAQLMAAVSGTLPELPFPADERRDPKSGALVISL